MTKKEHGSSLLDSIASTKFRRHGTAIGQAMDQIQGGLCKRVDVSSDIKVYACKNVIRIDIKREGV